MGIKRNRTEKFQDGGTAPKKSATWIDQFASALKRHGIPDKNIKYALAQVILEHGRKTDPKDHGYNVMNISANKSWAGKKMWRGDKDKTAKIEGQYFRVYDSIEDATKDYVKFLEREYPTTYKNLKEDSGTFEGFVEGLANGVRKDGSAKSYAGALDKTVYPGEKNYRHIIKKIYDGEVSKQYALDVPADKNFGDNKQAETAYYTYDNEVAKLEKPIVAEFIKDEDRKAQFEADKPNLMEKEGKFYQKITKTRKVDSKQHTDADFKEATGKFNFDKALLKARENGDEGMIKTLVKIKDEMGDSDISMTRNDLGSIDWNWKNKENLGSRESGTRGGKSKEALDFMLDNNFIDYNQVDENYEEADTTREWQDSLDQTDSQRNKIIADNAALENEYNLKSAAIQKDQTVYESEREEWDQKDAIVQEENAKAKAAEQAQMDALIEQHKKNGFQSSGVDSEKNKNWINTVVANLPGEGDMYEFNNALHFYDSKNKKLYRGIKKAGVYSDWEGFNQNTNNNDLWMNRINAVNDKGISAASESLIPKSSYRLNSDPWIPSETDMSKWYRPSASYDGEEMYRNSDGDYLSKNKEGYYRKWDYSTSGWGDNFEVGLNPTEGYKKFDFGEMSDAIEKSKIDFKNIPNIPDGITTGGTYKTHGSGDNIITYHTKSSGLFSTPEDYILNNGEWVRLTNKKNLLNGTVLIKSNPIVSNNINPNLIGKSAEVLEEGGNIPRAIGGMSFNAMNLISTGMKKTLEEKQAELRAIAENSLKPTLPAASFKAPAATNANQLTSNDDLDRMINRKLFVKGNEQISKFTKPATIQGENKNVTLNYDANVLREKSDPVYATARKSWKAIQNKSTTTEANDPLELKFNADYEEHMTRKPLLTSDEKWAAKFDPKRLTDENPNKPGDVIKKAVGAVDLGALAKFAFSKPVRSEVVKHEVARPGQVNVIAANTGMLTDEQRTAEQQMANQLETGSTSNPDDIRGAVAKSKAISDYRANIDTSMANQKETSRQEYSNKLNAINERDANYSQSVLENEFQNKSAEAIADTQYELLNQQRTGQLVADQMGSIASGKMAKDQIDRQLLTTKREAALLPDKNAWIAAHDKAGELEKYKGRSSFDNAEYIKAVAERDRLEQVYKDKDAELQKADIAQNTKFAERVAGPTTIGALTRKKSGGSIAQELIKENGKMKRARVKAESDNAKIAKSAAVEAQKLFIMREAEINKHNRFLLMTYFKR